MASFDLWALSYILLCIGIGSVYTDGTTVLGLRVLASLVNGLAFSIHLIP